MNSDVIRRLVFDGLAEHSLALVLTALGESGIIVAPIKGVVLARWLYAHVSERPYVDVDLLVPRASFANAVRVVAARGWPVYYHSAEMGELSFFVDQVATEIHAEVARLDLSRLSSAEVLARGRADRTTFPFEVLRIDDIDHFFILVANVVKDGFTYAKAHVPADLDRMLRRLTGQYDAIIARARSAALLTALHNTTIWMAEEHASEEFKAFASRLGPPRRRTFAATVRWYRQRSVRHPSRLSSSSGLVGVALATLTPDERGLQLRGLARLIRRGAIRKLGRDPG